MIHQHTRLQIMTALYRNGRASFTDLRDGLGLTSGNLAAHAGRLSEAGYLTARRALTGDGFVAGYVLTPAGAEAFRRYLDQIESLVRSARTAPARPPRT